MKIVEQFNSEILDDNFESFGGDGPRARATRHGAVGRCVRGARLRRHNGMDDVGPLLRVLRRRELGARQVANLVAGGLKALNLSISAKVLAPRPALTRTTPLGRTECQ